MGYRYASFADMEPLGAKLRKQRRRLGLTLDELAGRAMISKPYLSLIETGRVPNPPSDEKLRRLEQTLGFGAGELVTQAHLQRTPQDVRAVLGKLLERKKGRATPLVEGEVDDLSGVLRELVDRSGQGNERIMGNAVPVINRASAGYPKDFVDLSYPARVADQYVGCPEISDKDAFAARVHGDSMMPKYREGDIVIFAPSLAARNGDDCFVRFADGQTTFKRIFFETDGEAPVVRLQPRNEKYRPMVVRSQELAGMYRAAFRYERVDGE
jgi:phage repressor protein C with HTH and peptisase S24 domain